MAHPFETFEDLALAAAGVRGTTFLKPLAPPQPHAPPHGRRTAYLRYVREPDRLHTVTHTAPTATQLGTPSAQRGSARRRAHIQGAGARVATRGAILYIHATYVAKSARLSACTSYIDLAHLTLR